MRDPNDVPQSEGPPGVPPIDRRVHLYRWQVVGLGLLLLIPILAVLGAFDERMRHETGTDPALEVAVEYPERIRTTRDAALSIRVRNRSDRTVEMIRIVLPKSHLAGFDLTGILDEVSVAGYPEAGSLEPGDERRVRIALKAERVGRHRDTIWIVSGANGEDSLHIPLRTLILP